MEETKNKNILPVLMVITIIFGGYMISDQILKSRRPNVPTRNLLFSTDDKFNARLWQDPLKALFDHLATQKKEENTKDPNTLLCVEKNTHVIFIMIRDGTFAEDHERRLRNRYAVVTALHDQNFIPENSEHLSFFRFYTNQTACKPSEQKSPNNTPPIYIPYEWFKSTNDEQVLLIWLPESHFLKKPLSTLNQLVKKLNLTENNENRFILIGPSHSGTLGKMIENAKNPPDDLSKLENLYIYSPWSTVLPKYLIPPSSKSKSDSQSKPYSDETIIDILKDRKIHFKRMIGTDDLLSIYLIKELNLRGIDPLEGDHVALISEWDTLYGRVFTQTFKSVLINLQSQNPNNTQPINLSFYHYIRGIDGKLPQTSTSAKENEDNEAQNPLASLMHSKCPESPTGRSQLDYIRHLVMQMNQKYTLNKKSRPKAVGIVSSDVYDKLIVIQALREEFRDIPIFTVDIDSRLMHRNSFIWTRNLIVASNYGLTCKIENTNKPEMIRQFRDNYQTSLYTSCITALRDRCPMHRPQLTTPKLFEIGRDQAIELQMDNSGILREFAKISNSNMSGQMIAPEPPEPATEFCRNIMISWQYITLSIAAFISLLCLTPSSRKCLITIFTKAKNITDSSTNKNKYKEYRIELRVWFISSAVLVFTLMIIINFDHVRNNGEPFSLVFGTSIWPGSIIRLIAVIMGTFYLLISLKRLEENRNQIDKNYFPPCNPRNQQNHKKKKICNLKEYWKKNINIFSWNHKTNAYARQVWHRYTHWGKYRLPQTTFFTLIVFVITTILITMLEMPKTPFRGSLSKITNDFITALCAITILFMICFVFNSTCLCTLFIRNLNTPKTKWSQKLIKEKNAAIQMHHEDLIPYLKIKFIASRTDVVGQLVYYPSIMLFILIVSRSQFFDNWEFPLRLFVAYLVFFGIITCYAISMRRSAERARSSAVQTLQKNLSRAYSEKDGWRSEQIKLTIDEIKSIKQGAFSPLSENPVIHAILIPSGGTSLLMLLRIFMT